VNLKDLAAKIQRLEDLEEIKKLQRKYQYWLYKQDFEKIVENCFARKTPGVTMEASDSGIFKGMEGVKRFFLGLMRKGMDKPGSFTMHLAVGPVIEIAGDGKTARSIWFSPGCGGNKWVWGVYLVDYVKESETWKFWHMVFTPLFRTPYDKGWLQVPNDGTLRCGLEDAPPEHWNPYSTSKKGAELFAQLPEAPEPYETMEIPE
jgi:hypothetical protein